MGYIENKILGRDINSATGTANTTTYLRGDDSWATRVAQLSSPLK